ncbi:hypothetical protein PVK06_011736 [Gossypium arboreum]|uniref:Uncharacterized protein n=1 Tax=Gossypium arboreum TaxID=29729 RepID=A0ABR0QAE5_GOSAR|nr:hypothetical protein PVK06_011736 [Gossypium arboreum]
MTNNLLCDGVKGKKPVDSASVLDARLKTILENVRLNYLLEREEGGWDANLNWEDILSLGEQQRLGMVVDFGESGLVRCSRCKDDPQELEKYSDDNKELAWMFFVDGCAILQAVYMHYGNDDDDERKWRKIHECNPKVHRRYCYQPRRGQALVFSNVLSSKRKLQGNKQFKIWRNWREEEKNLNNCCWQKGYERMWVIKSNGERDIMSLLCVGVFSLRQARNLTSRMVQLKDASLYSFSSSLYFSILLQVGY